MPSHLKNKKSAGFTLIELLVVILVIGALSGVLLSVINSSGIRGKARDSQRKADVKKIQTALELYFSDNRTYPVSDDGGGAGSWELVGAGALGAFLSPDYIDPLPQDPKKEVSTDSDPCSNPTVPRYNYRSDGAYYFLTAIMEVETSNDDGECGSVIGCAAGYASENFCYYARNP